MLVILIQNIALEREGDQGRHSKHEDLLIKGPKMEVLLKGLSLVNKCLGWPVLPLSYRTILN